MADDRIVWYKLFERIDLVEFEGYLNKFKNPQSQAIFLTKKLIEEIGEWVVHHDVTPPRIGKTEVVRNYFDMTIQAGLKLEFKDSAEAMLFRLKFL